MEIAPMLAQPGSSASATWLRWLPWKIYEKWVSWVCIDPHSAFWPFRVHCSGLGSFESFSFRPDRNWRALRTQTKYTKHGKYGYRNTALASCSVSGFACRLMYICVRRRCTAPCVRAHVSLNPTSKRHQNQTSVYCWYENLYSLYYQLLLMIF